VAPGGAQWGPTPTPRLASRAPQLPQPPQEGVEAQEGTGRADAREEKLPSAPTRSPVLIPPLLRSWTISSVRPGHSPAFSTPMFPAGPDQPWAGSGAASHLGIRRASPDAPPRPFLGRAGARWPLAGGGGGLPFRDPHNFFKWGREGVEQER
jgi:hypothetical protein